MGFEACLGKRELFWQALGKKNHHHPGAGAKNCSGMPGGGSGGGGGGSNETRASRAAQIDETCVSRFHPTLTHQHTQTRASTPGGSQRESFAIERRCGGAKNLHGEDVFSPCASSQPPPTENNTHIHAAQTLLHKALVGEFSLRVASLIKFAQFRNLVFRILGNWK